MARKKYVISQETLKEIVDKVWLDGRKGKIMHHVVDEVKYMLKDHELDY